MMDMETKNERNVGMKITISSADWKHQISLQDLVVNSILNHPKLKIGILTSCDVAVPGQKKTTYFFNNYYILKLAKMDDMAEKLRNEFFIQYGIDISKNDTVKRKVNRKAKRKVK